MAWCHRKNKNWPHRNEVTALSYNYVTESLIIDHIAMRPHIMIAWCHQNTNNWPHHNEVTMLSQYDVAYTEVRYGPHDLTTKNSESRSGCFRRRRFLRFVISYLIGCLIFFRRRRNETEKSTVKFLLNDLWPLTFLTRKTSTTKTATRMGLCNDVIRWCSSCYVVMMSMWYQNYNITVRSQ